MKEKNLTIISKGVHMKISKNTWSIRLAVLMLMVTMLVCLSASVAFAAITDVNPLPNEVVPAPLTEISVAFGTSASDFKGIAFCSIAVEGQVLPALDSAEFANGKLVVKDLALGEGQYVATAIAVDKKLKTFTYTWQFAVGSASGGGETLPTELGATFPSGKIGDASPEVGAYYGGGIPDAATIEIPGVSGSPFAASIWVDKLYIPAGVLSLAPGAYDFTVTVDGDSVSGAFTVVDISASNAKCVTCHPISGHTFNDCVACHGAGSALGGGYTDPALSPHEEALGGACSGPWCHGSKTEVALGACSDCHTGGADVHHAVAEETEKCTDCHGIGSSEGTKACADCHSGDPHHVKAAEPAASCLKCHTQYSETGTMECGDCHEGGGHHGDAKFNAFCDGCHPNIGSSSGTQECSECHSADIHHDQADLDLAANKPCFRCHKYGSEEGEKSCSACHASAQTSQDAHHALAFWSYNNPSVQNQMCVGYCHGGVTNDIFAELGGYPGAIPDNVKPDALDCRDCHARGKIVTGAHHGYYDGGTNPVSPECAGSECHGGYESFSWGYCVECHLEENFTPKTLEDIHPVGWVGP